MCVINLFKVQTTVTHPHTHSKNCNKYCECIMCIAHVHFPEYIYNLEYDYIQSTVITIIYLLNIISYCIHTVLCIWVYICDFAHCICTCMYNYESNILAFDKFEFTGAEIVNCKCADVRQNFMTSCAWRNNNNNDNKLCP